MTYGPQPWQQRHWDARAAGNFMGGGAGSGLVVATSLAAPDPLGPMLAGLALIGLGLLCVWLEIGRPLRAANVFLNPRTSWMSREAAAALLLFPTALAAAAGVPGARWAAAALALAFLVAQSRMLRAARGIPAWRAPLAAPLVVVTGLTEGAGLLLLFTPALRWPFAALVLVRVLLWQAYRFELGAPAQRAFRGAGWIVVLGGSVLPLALVGAGAPSWGLASAGMAAAAAGAWLKLTLITRAAFNQGFALPHLPVRGARP